MTTRRVLFTILAAGMITATSATGALAQNDNPNRRTVLTFSQPFEIPGQVLPAGTYTFQLADTLADRHIVSISSADGSRQIAMVMGIAINRVESTTSTVVTFSEVPEGATDTIRTWFYPGRNAGVEFVYPKQRALELASTANVTVPAIAVDAPAPDLATVPIVAVTPDRREVPVTTVLEADAPAQQAAVTPAAPVTQVAQATQPQPRELPRTASTLYLLTIIGLASVCAATVALFIKKGRLAPAPTS